MGGEAARRVLLLLPKTSYRTQDFQAAARQLGVDVLVGSDRCHVLADEWPLDKVVTLDLDRADEAAARLLEAARRWPFAAAIATDERTALIAALVAGQLGLPHNPIAAARATRDKHALRLALRAAGLRTPAFSLHAIDDDPAAIARAVPYPCVLKPLLLSASQGVIRADDDEAFVAAFARLRRLLDCPELLAKDPAGVASRHLLVEAFVPGREVALEGLLQGGALRPLALFDKPDPLDGPFFEETLYITPSRLPEPEQEAIRRATAAAAAALDLREGPLHAELRLSPDGPVVLELAARSIGGLCSRTLRFGTGLTLEALILAHALGLPIGPAERERRAAGVMMVPIPRAGVLKAIHGIEAARAVPGIEEVTMSARIGDLLVPLPEGSSYLGFLFARAERPEEVEAILRQAHRALAFEVRPTLA